MEAYIKEVKCLGVDENGKADSTKLRYQLDLAGSGLPVPDVTAWYNSYSSVYFTDMLFAAYARTERGDSIEDCAGLGPLEDPIPCWIKNNPLTTSPAKPRWELTFPARASETAAEEAIRKIAAAAKARRAAGPAPKKAKKAKS